MALPSMAFAAAWPVSPCVACGGTPYGQGSRATASATAAAALKGRSKACLSGRGLRLLRRAVNPQSVAAQTSFAGTSPATSSFSSRWALGSTLLLAALRSGHRRSTGGPSRLSRRAEMAEAATAVAPPEGTPPAAGSQWARVAKRVRDVVITVTNPLGEEMNDRLPAIGDTVRFSRGAVGHVIAVSDLCFAAALSGDPDLVEEGDSYTIMPKMMRPTIRRPEELGRVQLVDVRGRELGAESSQRPELTEEESVPWFNEIVGIVRRQRIDAPLHAGVMGLDAFVPIGRGQSMLLRLPPGITSKQLRQYMAHIITAQGDSDVRCMVAAASPEEAQLMRELVGEAEAGKRVTIVANRVDEARPGEAVLAMNAACALAEDCRDDGGNALLLLDLEPMYKVWSILAEVSAAENLTERANKDQNEEIDKLSEDLGVELWKYVAKKNAVTARRRTFLGCFLQRAGRMADARGGGSLTLLGFARPRDSSTLGRLELEAKLKNLQSMNLDEAVRAKAVEKIQSQIAALPEDGVSGVPDDFVEEAKAVTDGHVVFSDASVGPDGQLRWCVDLKESVARGITANSVQNRCLDLLRSLRLKAYLMMAENEGQVMEDRGAPGEKGTKLDCSPLMALMHQPVGDVLSVKDEAALLLLALENAIRALDARPLAEAALGLLERARIRPESDQATKRRVSQVRRWAEANYSEDVQLQSLAEKEIEELADALELRPLERKRLLAAVGENAEASDVPVAPGVLMLIEESAFRYAQLRADLDAIREDLPDNLTDAGFEDEALLELFSAFRARIRSKLAAPN
ncbi:unnamed protein product [Polarella glacialis]|uniref:ATPase F1/V1/A1 complex alpha/beta subunit nucleotide-binding domain-containing protein n=1 Tax=Polarella glacialis TaxID=89957 RepID=A0A813LMA1_POLGL|nr:unnamed protein product [Polarella glacialis]CAE8733413.1 unnamed protein product [Polarella glacialis]